RKVSGDGRENKRCAADDSLRNLRRSLPVLLSSGFGSWPGLYPHIRIPRSYGRATCRALRACVPDDEYHPRRKGRCEHGPCLSTRGGSCEVSVGSCRVAGNARPSSLATATRPGG